MNRTFVPKTEYLTVKAQQLLRFLATNPYDSFNLGELAEQSQLPKSTVSRLLDQLEQEGFVRKEAIANLRRVRYDLDSMKARGYKISINLQNVYLSHITDFIRQVRGAPKAIVLFGSYRKGEDGPGSDIDIAVELNEDIEVELVELNRHDVRVAQLIKMEELLQRKFRIMYFNRKHVDPNIFTAVANGIVLYGLLEVKV